MVGISRSRWALAALTLGLSSWLSSASAETIYVAQEPELTGLGMLIKSPQREAQLGTAMAVGDFNGDGLMDLALGAPRQDSPRGISEAGTVSIFFNGGQLNASLGSIETNTGFEDMLLVGDRAQGFAGHRLAAGDLNGDGIDDLAVVAQRVNDTDAPVDPENARIYVVFGATGLAGTQTLSSVAGTTIVPDSSMHITDILIGDIDGDNIGDLVFADDLTDSVSHPPVAPLVDGQPRGINGAVFVYYGGRGFTGELTTALTAANSFDAMIAGGLSGDLIGSEVFQVHALALANIDGVGSPELILGTPFADHPSMDLDEVGVTYVLETGNISGSPVINGLIDVFSEAKTRITGAVVNDQAGERLVAGNLNGDNADDLVIGAPRSGWGQSGTTGKGRAYLLLGGTWGSDIDLFDQADSVLTLSADTARIGFKTGNALAIGNLNGDDLPDLLIATTNAFTTAGTNGWVHGLYGRSSWADSYQLDTEADLAILAPELKPTPPDPLSAGRMGSTIGIADFDNNGTGDIALGAPWGKGNNSMVGNGWVGVLFNPVGAIADGYDNQVYALFIGYFGRPPAPAGVDYYGSLMEQSPENWKIIADDFWNSTESRDQYPPSQGIREKINQVYVNLFGRSAASGGLDYWEGLINNGTVSLPEIAYTVAYNASAEDTAIFEAKIQTAKSWVQGLDTQEKKDAFQTASGIAAGRQFLATIVTPTPANQAQVDQAIAAMLAAN